MQAVCINPEELLTCLQLVMWWSEWHLRYWGNDSTVFYRGISQLPKYNEVNLSTQSCLFPQQFGGRSNLFKDKATQFRYKIQVSFQSQVVLAYTTLPTYDKLLLQNNRMKPSE